jgi:hypothetical protein
VRPQDAETQPRRRGHADRGRLAGGKRVLVARVVFGDMGHAGLQVRVGNLLEFLTQRADRADRAQTLLGVAPVLLEVLLNQALQQGAPLGRQRLLLQEDLSQRLTLVEHPGVHGGYEGVTGDEVQLQGEDAEQQIPVSVRSRRGHGRTS